MLPSRLGQHPRPCLPGPSHVVALRPSCPVKRRSSSLAVGVYAFYGPAAAEAAQQTRQSDAARRANELPALLQEIAETAIRLGPTGAGRALQAAQAVAVVGQEYLISMQRGKPEQPQVVLRKLFNQLGTTFIKLGQFVASSPTLFPPEYVAEFQQTLDRAPPVPMSAIEAILQQELGQDVQQLFSYIDPVPIATASVAQVHGAVLRANNKHVVLKVLKPGVESIMQSDLSFVYLSMKVLQFLNPELQRASLVDIVGDLRDAMTEEINFLAEASNIVAFRRYLSDGDLESVCTAPYVYRQMSTRRVLVMERLDGVPLTDAEVIRKATGGRDPQQILINALNVWFGSILRAPSFHADVHQGNLLVLPDGRVGFIDFGLVGKIPASTWPALTAALAAFASDDFVMLAKALATLQATSSDVDIQAFAADLKAMFDSISNLDPQVMVGISSGSIPASAAVADEEMNRLVLQLASAAERHGIRFPRVFAVLLKALLYWNAYIRILAPDMSVFQDERLILRDAIEPQ